MDYSIIIPVYNEASSLPVFLQDLGAFLSGRKESFEIVAVDDGSDDSSQEVLQGFQGEFSVPFRIVRHLYNRGYGSALRSGVSAARGRVVIYMDADGQHAAGEIDRLLEKIPPYDMVIGYRTGTYDGAWYRNLGNRFYNRFASWLTKFEVRDLTSGFRAIRRDAVMHFLPLYPAGFSASATVTLAMLKAGYSINYVPVEVFARSGGRSKVHFVKDGARFFALILRMVMLYEPLRIFLPISGGLFLLGVAAWAAGIIHAGRLMLPNSSIFLFTATLLVFLLGLLSSQLAANRIQYQGDEERIIIEPGADENGELER